MKTQKAFDILIFILIFSTLSLMTVTVSISSAEMAKGVSNAAMALPEPPANNPHPPVTESDKKRVAFGEEVLKKILMADVSKFSPDGQPVIANNDNSINMKITAACLALPECVQHNRSLLNYTYSINQMYGQVVEFRHTHVIPWSFENFERNKTAVDQNDTEKLLAKPTQKFLENKADQEAMPAPVLQKDEYMLHSYINFGKDYRWHHVDIIVSEDAQGNLEFRRFFIIRIPFDGGHLPDGVVC